MNEVEIIQQLNSKRGELEEKRSQNAGSDVITALESEIEELTTSLSNVDKSNQETVFLDECSG